MTDPTDAPLIAVAEVEAKPQPGDDRYWSVTTILKSYGDSEALISWSASETAKAAIRKQRTWQAMVEDEGEDAAIGWLAQQRFNPPKGERSATALGEAVHAAIEYLVVNGHRPPHGYQLSPKAGQMDAEVDPYLDNFDMWLDYAQPVFEAAEMTVYNDTYQYAGTLDGIATIQGQRVVIDYKTSKKSTTAGGKRAKPWKDVVLQTNAYRWAEFAAVWRARKFESYSRRYYLLNADERELAVPMPKTDGAVAVHITPQHCDMWPIPSDEAVFERFLYAIENARTDIDLSRDWLKEPIILLDRKAS
jgi:hypothetical protein